jgi:hypothetical protein
VRVLTASTGLTGYLSWLGVAQVFRVERTRVQLKRGTVQQQTVYGLTDLTPAQASAADLLTYVRGHWLIENQSHWIRDVVFNEDRSQVRVGSLPEVLAALRNTSLGLLRSSGETRIAATTRRLAAQPWQALRLLGITREN